MAWVCQLPYPDRFYAAAQFAQNPSKESAYAPSNETRLLLYALYQQSVEGACTGTAPGMWNVVDRAKYTAWKGLGRMSEVEAMRLYVRTLEEEVPRWWQFANADDEEGDDEDDEDEADVETGGEDIDEGMKGDEAGTVEIAAFDTEDQWTEIACYGDKPVPRYEHSMSYSQGRVVVIAGNCGGRYLNDIRIFDVASRKWTRAKPCTESGDDASFPRSAGHATCIHEEKILIVGGYQKSSDGGLNISLLDPRSMCLTHLRAQSSVPETRGWHSVTLINKKLYIYGGETKSRRLLGELLTFDLVTNEWDHPETVGDMPQPRAAHAATAVDNRYLVIFGGGSIAHCFNDIHVLDTYYMEWFQPDFAGGMPSPRAGHAGTLIGHEWLIVGGGNNYDGIFDTIGVDLSNLDSDDPLQWRSITTVDKKSAVVSEGLSVVTVEGACAGNGPCLLAYGGYNGKYHSSVHVLRPSLVSASKFVSRPPHDDRPPMSRRRSSALSSNSKGDKEEELANLRREVEVMTRKNAEAESTIQALKSKLTEEQGKVFRLEVALSEAKQSAESVQGESKGLWSFIR